MKKSTLLFFLALPPIGLWAQDSGEEVGRRVLSLGRSWNYKRKTADGTTETVSLTLVRDTTIAGHQAFIASYKTPEGYKECFALQEEETGEVFSYDISHEMEKNGLIPMARLSMGISEFSWYDSSGLIRTETLPGTLQVQDEVVANGITRQRWQFFSDNMSSPSDIWVSGIGSQTYGILLPSRQADFVGEDKLQFMSCTDADDTDPTVGRLLENNLYLEDIMPDHANVYQINSPNSTIMYQYSHFHISVNNGGSWLVNRDHHLFNGSKVTIKNGGMLIINNGSTLYNAIVEIEPGGKLLISGGGKMRMASGHSLDAPIGAIIEIENGSIEPLSN